MDELNKITNEMEHKDRQKQGKTFIKRKFCNVFIVNLWIIVSTEGGYTLDSALFAMPALPP